MIYPVGLSFPGNVFSVWRWCSKYQVIPFIANATTSSVKFGKVHRIFRYFRRMSASSNGQQDKRNTSESGKSDVEQQSGPRKDENDVQPNAPPEEPPDNSGMVLAAYGYVLGDSLGKGSYAVVKVAFSKKLRRQVAIKIILKKKAPQDYITKFLPREVAVMRQLNHPNIIGLYEAIETSTRIYLIMDMADGGDLLEYIKTNGAISESEARRLFRQLIDASDYLHRRDVVHRDLKCENILLDHNKNVLVSDFGFARMQPIEGETGKRKLSSTFCGSYAYAPPEILRGIAYDGTRSDVWSLGVVLYTMLCAKLPFDDSNLKLLMEQISKPVTFSRKRKVSDEAKHLISKMLCEEKDRIDIGCIRDHPWVTGQKMNELAKANKRKENLAKAGGDKITNNSQDSGLGNETDSAARQMEE